MFRMRAPFLAAAVGGARDDPRRPVCAIESDGGLLVPAFATAPYVFGEGRGRHIFAVHDVFRTG